MSSKKVSNKIEKLVILNSPKVKQKILDIRNTDTDATWTDIARKINTEFGIYASTANVKSIYENELAMEIEMSGNKEKYFSDNISLVQKRYEDAADTAEKFGTIVKRSLDKLSEMPDEALVENIDEVLKAGRQTEVYFKIVDRQVSLVLSEQEKVSVKMNKNRKELTSQDIMKKINEFRPEMLRALERQGKIKIYDTALLK